jgi:DNA integrity scanning protein DisA with diadenylate cyclase activity
MMLTNQDDKRKADDLELILSHTEANAETRKTILSTYDALVSAKENVWEDYARRHGMFIMIGYDQHTSDLKVNGWQAKTLEGYNVHDHNGKEKIKELLRQDGATVVNATTGTIESYHRHVHVDPEQVALERKIIKSGEQISSVQMGFDEKARKELCGEEDYEGVGTKHQTALAATAQDSKLYSVVLSEETGAIVVMKDYKIIFSTIPSEIHPSHRKYLASFTHAEHPSPGKSKPTTNDSAYSKPMSSGEEMFLSFKIRQEAKRSLRHSYHGAY